MADAATCPAGDPETDSSLVTEAHGFFVAPPPMGDDAHPGTRASPFATVTKAVSAASSSSKSDVFVCQGMFNEWSS